MTAVDPQAYNDLRVRLMDRMDPGWVERTLGLPPVLDTSAADAAMAERIDTMGAAMARISAKENDDE